MTIKIIPSPGWPPHLAPDLRVSLVSTSQRQAEIKMAVGGSVLMNILQIMENEDGSHRLVFYQDRARKLGLSLDIVLHGGSRYLGSLRSNGRPE